MNAPTGPTALDVARWMVEEVTGKNFLPQGLAAREIKRRFGDDFLYWNKNHQLAIASSVLHEFERLSGDDVVWEKSTRRWATRQSYHKPGRSQNR